MTSSTAPALPELEFRIFLTLHRLGSATPVQVWRALPSQSTGYNTVQKLLRRMHERGVLQTYSDKNRTWWSISDGIFSQVLLAQAERIVYERFCSDPIALNVLSRIIEEAIGMQGTASKAAS